MSSLSRWFRQHKVHSKFRVWHWACLVCAGETRLGGDEDEGRFS